MTDWNVLYTSECVISFKFCTNRKQLCFHIWYLWPYSSRHGVSSSSSCWGRPRKPWTSTGGLSASSARPVSHGASSSGKWRSCYNGRLWKLNISGWRHLLRTWSTSWLGSGWVKSWGSSGNTGLIVSHPTYSTSSLFLFWCSLFCVAWFLTFV